VTLRPAAAWQVLPADEAGLHDCQQRVAVYLVWHLRSDHTDVYPSAAPSAVAIIRAVNLEVCAVLQLRAPASLCDGVAWRKVGPVHSNRRRSPELLGVDCHHFASLEARGRAGARSAL
jgi:hypothetical protein